MHLCCRASQVVPAVKNLPASAGDLRHTGSIPGSGRCPAGGHSHPLQYSCLENPMDREAWQATVHKVAESDTPKWLSTHAGIAYTWNLKHATNERICETDSQTWRTGLRLTREGLGRKHWEFGGKYKLLYVAWRSNKVLVHHIRNHIQYPVINHDGKYEKEFMCIHMCMTESICCRAEINTTLSINYSSIKLFFKKKRNALLKCIPWVLHRIWVIKGKESLNRIRTGEDQFSPGDPRIPETSASLRGLNSPV